MIDFYPHLKNISFMETLIKELLHMQTLALHSLSHYKDCTSTPSAREDCILELISSRSQAIGEICDKLRRKQQNKTPSLH